MYMYVFILANREDLIRPGCDILHRKLEDADNIFTKKGNYNCLTFRAIAISVLNIFPIQNNVKLIFTI